MALEQAGVELVAKNFDKYLKQLDEINKSQQEVFNVSSAPLDKAFNSATKSAKKYDAALKKTNTAQQSNQKSQLQLANGLKNVYAGAVAFATSQVVGFAAESAKLAGQFNAQQTGLNNLAASFGQSGAEIQAAIQTASRGTISGLEAIQAANQGLLLGVAQTPEEFSQLTETALTLGRAMGLTGTQAIEQFTTALGRRSLLILDNFGISAKSVNAEVERLAQQNFGMMNSQLSEAQKNTVFMEAALNIAGDAASAIGTEAGKAAESFERFQATTENLTVTVGEVLRPAFGGILDLLSRAAVTAQQFLSFVAAGAAGIGTVIEQAGNNLKAIFSGDELTGGLKDFDTIMQEASQAAVDRFKEVAATIEGVSFDTDEIEATAQAFDDTADAVEDNTQELEALGQAIKQAEALQLSFARASEDAARKAARQVSKLESRQAKDRDKLLRDQQKQLEAFERDRRKQIAKAERDIQKERERAAQQRLRDQQKLQQQLRQAQERFNLDQLQSERRFQLSERRLRAEGDILGLQQLREDQELARQEAQENFDLEQQQTQENAELNQQEQAQDLDNRLADLKQNLEDQRAELLAGFDEQLAAQQESQQEARDQLAQSLLEQEEDRRISQARQLEDLGRNLADQEGVTAEGTSAIATELEKIFGMEGVADNIMGGFADRTESDFTVLFENLEQIVSSADLSPDPSQFQIPEILQDSSTPLPIHLPGFDDGGTVPGPIGSPQPILAHGGETILPTHKTGFTMSAPIVPSQTVNVEMSGGFNISGGEAAGETVVRKAVEEMTDVVEIAVKRLARREG